MLFSFIQGMSLKSSLGIFSLKFPSIQFKSVWKNEANWFCLRWPCDPSQDQGHRNGVIWQSIMPANTACAIIRLWSLCVVSMLILFICLFVWVRLCFGFCHKDERTDGRPDKRRWLHRSIIMLLIWIKNKTNSCMNWLHQMHILFSLPVIQTKFQEPT